MRSCVRVCASPLPALIDIHWRRQYRASRQTVNIVKATQRYEEWLAQQTQIVKPDLRLKHQSMTQAAFPFLRATYYRWAQVWPAVCADLAKAPRVLAVGDLHVENFGTWRDAEGRLVWGINDFDEACVLPYTNDLVRLAVSALLAVRARHLAVKGKAACAAILEGYRKSLAKHGRPFVLEEQNDWLRQVASSELRDPVHFWARIDGLRRVKEKISPSARSALESLLPGHGLDYKVLHRIAGLGSLGRVRLVATAEHCGGRIAREAKACVPSAVHWAKGTSGEVQYQTIIQRAVRCPDPFVQLHGRWIVRRLSPSCCRIPLRDLPTGLDELQLLFAMGWETANIHLGSRGAVRPLQRHLHRQKPIWLFSAAKQMAEAVTEDWRAWKKSHPS
jgi:hypothetical protein